MEAECVQRLTRKINYLNKNGLGKDIAYILLNPEYFDEVRKHLGSIVAIDYDSVNHIEFFKFKGKKVGKHGDIRGDYIMPVICKNMQN